VYNTIAPYTVRRNHYDLDAELAECFRDCEPLIKEELQKRAQGVGTLHEEVDDGTRRVLGKTAGREVRAQRESMWRAFKSAVKEMVAPAKAP
jgi:hypothetical protein